MKVTGTIKLIGATQTYGSNGFRKREVVVITEEQYPQHILVEFVQDKCDLLDSFNIGQQVKIGINLRGRGWVNPQGETKFLNSVQGWRIEAVGGNQAPFETTDAPNNPTADDLPF